MNLILIYGECDGDIFIEVFKDRHSLCDKINRLKLGHTDYALIEGNVLKSFDNKSFDIRRMQHK